MSSDQGYHADQEDQLSKVEKRVQQMDFSNQNLANQVIATLNTVNENINSLDESLKKARIGREKDDKASMDFGQVEGEMNETRLAWTLGREMKDDTTIFFTYNMI